MAQEFHVDPVEWGKQVQLTQEIHDAIKGDDGVLAQLKKQNGRIGKSETWITRVGVAVGILSPITIFMVIQFFIHLTK